MLSRAQPQCPYVRSLVGVGLQLFPVNGVAYLGCYFLAGNVHISERYVAEAVGEALLGHVACEHRRMVAQRNAHRALV